MDTTSFTEPISRVGHQVGDRLPSTSSLVTSVTDATTDLADRITDQVGDIDVAEAVRRGRRTVAHVVPWMSVGPSRRFATRRWLVAAGVAAAIVAVALVLRRRAAGPTEPPSRDDWSTGSANGTRPPADTRRADRETATSNA